MEPRVRSPGGGLVQVWKPNGSPFSAFFDRSDRRPSRFPLLLSVRCRSLTGSRLHFTKEFGRFLNWTSMSNLKRVPISLLSSAFIAISADFFRLVATSPVTYVTGYAGRRHREASRREENQSRYGDTTSQLTTTTNRNEG